MRAAYLNQAINLIVGILMVPLLLRYLDIGHYVLWVIFTTFGGVTLQIESSIQVVSVREIAKQYHAADLTGLRQAVGHARRAYLALAAGVMLPIAIGGAAYLAYAANGRVAPHWGVEWLVFSGAYALNYYFGANSALLLALAKVESFNVINALTRTLNFAGTLVLLMLGFSVMGICISFAASVALGCSLIAMTARKALRQAELAMAPGSAASNTAHGVKSRDIARYTAYTFSAFVLYKGALLIAASMFPKEVVGPYSLALQALTMLSAVALVPIQVWLARLVRAVIVENVAAVVRELARTFLYANLVFAAGTGFLAVFGNDLLWHIGARVALPATAEVCIMAFAFLVELNIFICINLLVTTRQYGFVKTYVACAAAGLLLGTLAVAVSKALVLSLVVIPAAIQALVCLPLTIKSVCAKLQVTPAAFMALMAQNMLARP